MQELSVTQRPYIRRGGIALAFSSGYVMRSFPALTYSPLDGVSVQVRFAGAGERSSAVGE